MSTITINGKTYRGKSVSVHNNIVYIDGKQVDGEPNEKGILSVEIIGDAVSVQSDCSVAVSGQVLGDVVAEGSVSCGDVAGAVRAEGSVNCKNVGGYIISDGSVNCGNVGGDIKADGSVYCKK